MLCAVPPLAVALLTEGMLVPDLPALAALVASEALRYISYGAVLGLGYPVLARPAMHETRLLCGA
jgi:hypothetical protein